MPPKIVSEAAVRVEPGSEVHCSATGTLPIYMALICNFTVVMNTTNIASSKLYQEGNYTCVATSKYGTDVKHFVIKGGEKRRYFKTNPMQGVAKRGWGMEVGVGKPIINSCPGLDTNGSHRLAGESAHRLVKIPFWPVVFAFH